MKRTLRNSSLFVSLSLGIFGVLLAAGAVTAQEANTPLDSEGRLVRFSRDIAPVFASRCGECHLGDKPKADFLVSDRDSVLAYLTPGDATDSMLYTDYLVTEDVDMLMPPESHGGPMPAAELALIRTWIEEGADWPEDAVVGSASDGEETEATDADQTSAEVVPFLPEPYNRYWEFQGYFHPAVVHFPIALLSVGAMFVVLGVVWPKVGTQIPLACLLIGAASSIVACAMGWAFADEQGYPNYSAGWDKEITPHRWSGIIVAALSSVMAILAIIGVRKERRGVNFLWKTGLLALAVMVGLVGHQGGELTYGKEHYQKAFAKLKTTDGETPSPSEDADGSGEGGEAEAEALELAEPELSEPTEEAPPAPQEETPVEEVPVEETPAEETPAEETPAEEVPGEESPTAETPAEETPAAEDSPSSDAPSGD